MKTKVYNSEGKETGEISLPKQIFEVAFNADLVHQVLVSQSANKRQVSAHAKDRSEVRGGGKKPWRQKGTGRARVGSIRSPLWRGGGVTFGPRNDKNYAKTVPSKMRRKALFMALSQKAKNDLMIVLEELGTDIPKTKEMSLMIKRLPGSKESRLVLTNGSKNLFLSLRNIKKTGVLEARNLNLIDLMNYKYLLLSKDTIKEIESTFSGKAKSSDLKQQPDKKS